MSGRLHILLVSLIIASPVISQESASHQHELSAPPSDSERVDGGYSLESLQAIAMAHNPTLLQAQANIDASSGKAVQAGLLPNPIVGYQAEQVGAAGMPGELQGGFVQQEIPLGGKLRLSRAKYRQETGQAALRLNAQQYRVTNGVAAAYFDVLAAQRSIHVRQDLNRLSDDALKTTREMLNVGQANEADVYQAEVQVDRVKFEVRAAEIRLLKEWQRLAAILGQPDLAYAPVTGDLEPQGEPLDFNTELCRVFDESPELKTLEAEVVRDQISLRRERVEPIPNLMLRGATGYNFETGNTVADASVGVRVPIFDRNQGTIQQAQAEVRRAQADVVRFRLQLQQRLADAFSRYNIGWEAVRLIGQSALPKAKKAFENQEKNFKQRRAAWPLVLVAQRDYVELNDQYVDALRELRHAEVEIRGLLLVDGLTSPPEPAPQSHRDAVPKPR